MTNKMKVADINTNGTVANNICMYDRRLRKLNKFNPVKMNRFH